MATLQLMVFDVDRNTQPPSGSVPEIDRVFFNGEEIATLEGENNLWQLNEFEIPIEKVRFPERAGVGEHPRHGNIRVAGQAAQSAQLVEEAEIEPLQPDQNGVQSWNVVALG